MLKSDRAFQKGNNNHPTNSLEKNGIRSKWGNT